jgi:hypothetical protein
MPATFRGGIPLRKLVAVSLTVLCLGAGQVQAASVACFAPGDAKQAHLRQMQQEFTVAALSCGSVQPQHETMADRYNAFIEKFATVLHDNARALLVHFNGHGGTPGFDSWMTKLANAASVRAATEPDYCDRALTALDTALLITARDIADFAVSNTAASELVPVCRERQARKHAHTVSAAEPDRTVAAE